MVAFTPKDIQASIKPKKVLNIDALRRISGGNIDKLPTVWVHTVGWTGKPFKDAQKRIHMNKHQFEALRCNFGMKFLRPIMATITEWAFDLQPHHLEGGKSDNFVHEGDHQGIREELGYDGETGEPKLIVEEYNDVKKKFSHLTTSGHISNDTTDLLDRYLGVKNRSA